MPGSLLILCRPLGDFTLGTTYLETGRLWQAPDFQRLWVMFWLTQMTVGWPGMCDRGCS